MTILDSLEAAGVAWCSEADFARLIAVARAAQVVHYWLWERDAHWTDDAEAITATEDAAQVLDAALAPLTTEGSDE